MSFVAAVMKVMIVAAAVVAAKLRRQSSSINAWVDAAVKLPHQLLGSFSLLSWILVWVTEKVDSLVDFIIIQKIKESGIFPMRTLPPARGTLC